MKDQWDKVGGRTALNDDGSLEWRCSGIDSVGRVFIQAEGWKVCDLVAYGEEEDEGDDSSNANDA